MINKSFYAWMIILSFFISCTHETNDEKIVKEFVKKNMNDPKSYEPVEFKVTDSTAFINLKIFDNQFNSLQTVYDRRSKLLPTFINSINSENENIDNYINELTFQYRILMPINLSNLNSVLLIQNQISRTVDSLIRVSDEKITSNQSLLDIQAQMEGIENRIEVEKRTLFEILNSYGLHLGANMDIVIIYHKYRGKNAFGALVLQESIFIVDRQKQEVINFIDF